MSAINHMVRLPQPVDGPVGGQPQQPSQAGLFLVAKTKPGYAREDAEQVDVIGLFTCEQTARKIASIAHAICYPVDLDRVAPGLVQGARELGLDLDLGAEQAPRTPRVR